MPTQPEGPKIQAGGLVTVAFLKARLDEGDDHFGIFMPLLMDVLARLPSNSFTAADVQEALAGVHGVAMPQQTVATLLKRAVRGGYALREAGLYRRSPTRELPPSNVAAQKARIEAEHKRLGEALQNYAATRGLAVASTDAALDMLFAFLEHEQVALLLGSAEVPTVRVAAGPRHRAVIAEFVQHSLSPDSSLLAVVSRMLEGLVLYHAAFLPDLGSSNHGFRDLRVVFDSVLVRQALGYEGVAPQILMRETVDILRAGGARCLVFDKTVHEIQRILGMYEDRLATAEGRMSLRPMPMARHFLTQRYSPSDIRQMSALLDREIAAAGFQIQRTPRHVPKYTAGERALAQRLADPVTKDEMEPRVTHDVDCVAGVLTLREGHRSHRLDDVRVVFATSSPLVIRNTRAWWQEDEQETGIEPIVDIRALANVAWLRRPSLCSDFKVRELVALCTAALRPSHAIWARFLRHLESLEKSRKLDSDETAAIVISAMLDPLLREAELEAGDPSDIDAVTLDEIVERVKASYAAKADERVREVTDQYESRLSELEAREQATAAREQAAAARVEAAEHLAAVQARRHESVIEGRARAWARCLARGLWGLLTIVVLAGAGALIVEHPFGGGLTSRVIGFSVVAFVLLEVVGILRHLSEWRAWMEARLTCRFRDRLRADTQAPSGVPS